MPRPMRTYSVDWSQMTLAQLERHVTDLEAVSKTPSTALLAALRAKREEAQP